MYDKCRECGCTQFNACVDRETGETCSWAEPDLCSFCAEASETQVLLASEADANRAIAEYRAWKAGA